MKSFLLKVLGIVIVTICFFSAPQTLRANSTPILKKSVSLNDTSTDWVLQSDTSGVKAYYRISTCGVFPAVLLKFTNTNSSTVTINWENIISIGNSYNETLAGNGTFVLQAGETVSAESCALPVYPQLVIRNVSLQPEVIIQKFVFQNLRVTL